MINAAQIAFVKAVRAKDESQSLSALAQIEELDFIMKNQRTGSVFSCIHLVSENNLIGVLKGMIVKRFTISAQDSEGETGLFIAQRSNNPELIQLFMEREPLLCLKANNQGVTPIHLAAQLNDLQSLEIYLQTIQNSNTICDHKGKTPLHWAAEYGHCEAVDLLIHYGAQVNVIDQANLLPRHLSHAAGFQLLANRLKRKENTLFERCALAVQHLSIDDQMQIPDLIRKQQLELVSFHQVRNNQMERNNQILAKNQEMLSNQIKNLHL